MKYLIGVLLASTLALPLAAQTPSSSPPAAITYTAKHPPRFEDFPVSERWDRARAPVQLTTSSERMFRTELTDASEGGPNFAGHYTFAIWRCGSNCAAGAVIDLRTGRVFPPPLGAHGDGWGRWCIAAGLFDGAAIDFQVNSRLVVIKSGLNFSEERNVNVPDEDYFVWEDNRFRQLLHVSGKQHSGVTSQ